MATTAPVIDVIDPSGRRHTVNGRAADWVELVLTWQDKINAMDRGNALRIIGHVLRDMLFLDSIATGHVRVDFAPEGTTYTAQKVERG